MEEVLIGVDYSINSPAICIYRNNTYNWISFPVLNKSKKDQKIQDDISKFSDVNYKLQEKFIINGNYEDQDFQKIIKYDINANIILTLLNFYLPKQPYKLKIAFEGYSYGSRFSKTNNIIELVTATTLFKKTLLQNLIEETDIIKVYSPKTIKMQAGNGNMKKRELFDVFIQNRLADSNLEKSVFWHYCTNLLIGSKVPSPIDDMIDAYFVVKTLQNLS